MARALEGESIAGNHATAEDRLVALMRDHKTPLFNFLLVLVGDRDVASDCAQDAFVRAYEQMQRGKTITAPWLYRVARNRAMDEFRHRKRVKPDLDVLSTLPAHEPEHRGAAVRQALERLTTEDREILYLFICDRFKTAEIGSMLGIGAGAARMRISRARERFRLIYGDAQ
jgi:RNA polymerase sigma-70 factor (ECF subfamily)